MSRDVADVITVLDGRETIASEARAAKPSLRSYLAKRFSTLLETQLFLDSLPGHLPPDKASQLRSGHVLERAKAIAGCDLR